jgi:hypothetical protein
MKGIIIMTMNHLHTAWLILDMSKKGNIFSGLLILHRVQSKNPIEIDDHAVMGIQYNHVLENGCQG